MTKTEELSWYLSWRAQENHKNLVQQ